MRHHPILDNAWERITSCCGTQCVWENSQAKTRWAIGLTVSPFEVSPLHFSSNTLFQKGIGSLVSLSFLLTVSFSAPAEGIFETSNSVFNAVAAVAYRNRMQYLLCNKNTLSFEYWTVSTGTFSIVNEGTPVILSSINNYICIIN